MNLDLQRELFETVLNELTLNDDLINIALEITADDDELVSDPLRYTGEVG